MKQVFKIICPTILTKPSDITIDEQFWFNNDNVIKCTVGIDGSLNIVDPQPSTSHDQSGNTFTTKNVIKQTIPEQIIFDQKTPDIYSR